MRLTWFVPVALAVGLGLTAGCSKQEEPTPPPTAGQVPGPPMPGGPPPGVPGGMPAPGAKTAAPDSAKIALGATVYANNCAKCHGPTGKTSDPAKPDFTSAAWHAANPDAQVKEYISAGVPPKMPAFKDKLKAAEMDALVEALRSFVQPPAQ